MNQRLFTMRIDTRGVAETIEDVQRLRTGLADRKQLHARLAIQGAEFTRDYLRKDNAHGSAQRLGAKPTGHRAKAAKGIESDSNADAAIIRIPRSSGLYRAFTDFVIVPGSGKKFLTIPADRATYGRRAGEFPPGTFAFTIIGGRYPALVFREGWKLAYWLRRSVKQKQDRTLLPNDEGYRKLARGVTGDYISELRSGKGGPE